MNMYLELMDDTIKQPHENPAIGIILCAAKNNIIAEYELKKDEKKR